MTVKQAVHSVDVEITKDNRAKATLHQAPISALGDTIHIALARLTHKVRSHVYHDNVGYIYWLQDVKSSRDGVFSANIYVEYI